MKTIFLFVLLVPFSAAAQFEKGTIFVGGFLSTSSASTSSTGSPKLTDVAFSINPQAGCFLNARLAVGLGATYRYTKDKQENNYRQIDKSFSIAPFARYYIPLANDFYFALQAQYLIGKGEQSLSYGGGSDSVKTFESEINVRPMLVFFPSARWSVEAGLGSVGWAYSSEKDGGYKAHVNAVALNLGQLNLGVAFYFNK